MSPEPSRGTHTLEEHRSRVPPPFALHMRADSAGLICFLACPYLFRLLYVMNCGSADLAPSFIKRHDARCRPCFTQRYGFTNRQQSPLSFPRGEPQN